MRRQLSHFSRQKPCSPEIQNLFDLVNQEKIQELTSFILNEQNEVWNMKKGDDITILHNACVNDKFNLVKLIIDNTKKRLHLTPDSTLSSEEKSANEKIFKDFINAKTETEYLTALHYASFRGNIKIIKLLIENNAEVAAISYNGLNMLHKAAQGNQPSAIVYFNKKYNINLESSDNALLKLCI